MEKKTLSEYNAYPMMPLGRGFGILTMWQGGRERTAQWKGCYPCAPWTISARRWMCVRMVVVVSAVGRSDKQHASQQAG
jgi:hypothetical protein